jgi:hypothetical protein
VVHLECVSPLQKYIILHSDSLLLYTFIYNNSGHDVPDTVYQKTMLNINKINDFFIIHLQ